MQFNQQSGRVVVFDSKRDLCSDRFVREVLETPGEKHVVLHDYGIPHCSPSERRTVLDLAFSTNAQSRTRLVSIACVKTGANESTLFTLKAKGDAVVEPDPKDPLRLVVSNGKGWISISAGTAELPISIGIQVPRKYPRLSGMQGILLFEGRIPKKALLLEEPDHYAERLTVEV